MNHSETKRAVWLELAELYRKAAALQEAGRAEEERRRKIREARRPPIQPLLRLKQKSQSKP